MTPEKLGHEALLDALTDILAVRKKGNGRLRLLGVVLSQLDARTRAATECTDRIKEKFAKAGDSHWHHSGEDCKKIIANIDALNEILRLREKCAKLGCPHAGNPGHRKSWRNRNRELILCMEKSKLCNQRISVGEACDDYDPLGGTTIPPK